LQDILDGKNAVFIYPTMPHAAVFHKQSCFVPFNSSYTALFNLLKLPVTQVPLGLNSDCLPIGVQVYTNDEISLHLFLDF
jgi:fatty acid amide hydrolase 2